MKIGIKSNKSQEIAKEKKWRDFEGTTEEELLEMFERLSGMAYRPAEYDWKVWWSRTGVDPRLFPEWIESNSAGKFFINREGLEVLKLIETQGSVRHTTQENWHTSYRED